MEEMFNHIANFGFPMVLSIYLLVRLEGKIDNLSASIQKLSLSLDDMNPRKQIG